MADHIPAFRLRDALADLSYSGGLDADGLYRLVLAATGDEDEAARAWEQRAQARSRAGLPM